MTGQHHDDDAAERMMHGLHGEEPLDPPADLAVDHDREHAGDGSQDHVDAQLHDPEVVDATAAQGKPRSSGRLILLIGVGVLVLVLAVAGGLMLRATLHKQRLQREAAAQAAQEAAQAEQAAQVGSAPPQPATGTPADSPAVAAVGGQGADMGSHAAAASPGTTAPGPVLAAAPAPVAAAVAQTAAAAQIQGVSDRVDALSKNVDTLQGRVSTLEVKSGAPELTHHAAKHVRVVAAGASSAEGGVVHHAGMGWHGRAAHRMAKGTVAPSTGAAVEPRSAPVEVAVAGVRLRGVYPPTGESRRAWVLENGAVRSVVVGDSVRGARVTAITSDHVDTDIGVIR